MPKKAAKTKEEKVVEEKPVDKPTPADAPKKRGFRLTRRTIFISFGVLVFLAAAAVPSYYFYDKYTKARAELTATGDQKAQQEIQDIMKKVGEHVLLPSGEQPSVATVSDKSKLAGQVFFARAENGDKVLIYTNTKKAYLYRPSIDKVIEVGPISISQSTPSAQIAGEQTEEREAAVVLYNGTTVTGLTRRVENGLGDAVKNIKVVDRANASRQDYTSTIVIDLTGKNKEKAQEIATVLEGSVGTIPEGETKPAADILVIIGQDYTQ